MAERFHVARERIRTILHSIDLESHEYVSLQLIDARGVVKRLTRHRGRDAQVPRYAHQQTKEAARRTPQVSAREPSTDLRQLLEWPQALAVLWEPRSGQRFGTSTVTGAPTLPLRPRSWRQSRDSKLSSGRLYAGIIIANRDSPCEVGVPAACSSQRPEPSTRRLHATREPSRVCRLLICASVQIESCLPDRPHPRGLVLGLVTRWWLAVGAGIGGAWRNDHSGVCPGWRRIAAAEAEAAAERERNQENKEAHANNP